MFPNGFGVLEKSEIRIFEKLMRNNVSFWIEIYVFGKKFQIFPENQSFLVSRTKVLLVKILWLEICDSDLLLNSRFPKVIIEGR